MKLKIGDLSYEGIFYLKKESLTHAKDIEKSFDFYFARPEIINEEEIKENLKKSNNIVKISNGEKSVEFDFSDLYFFYYEKNNNFLSFVFYNKEGE